ncbi:hypothetical protein BT69DRAFT_1355839 [Atractiella rhizophila]|nr:hypothetical protein BT69DRAFT_1355839 [Atractiella rhizophila]
MSNHCRTTDQLPTESQPAIPDEVSFIDPLNDQYFPSMMAFQFPNASMLSCGTSPYPKYITPSSEQSTVNATELGQFYPALQYALPYSSTYHWPALSFSSGHTRALVAKCVSAALVGGQSILNLPFSLDVESQHAVESSSTPRTYRMEPTDEKIGHKVVKVSKETYLGLPLAIHVKKCLRTKDRSEECGIPLELYYDSSLHPLTGERINRPRNKFMLFRSANDAKYRPLFPAAKDLAKYMGRLWERLPEEEKEWYAIQSDMEVRRHKELYPWYIFSHKGCLRLDKQRAAETLGSRMAKQPHSSIIDNEEHKYNSCEGEYVGEKIVNDKCVALNPAYWILNFQLCIKGMGDNLP